MPDSNRIRPYDGPETEHRYRTYLDKWVHLMSVGEEAIDDEAGDADGPHGWSGLLIGIDVEDLESIAKEEDGLGLNDREISVIEGCAGAIVSEDRDGRVKVEYYQGPDELKDAWETIIDRDPEYDGDGFPGDQLTSVDAEDAEEILPEGEEEEE